MAIKPKKGPKCTICAHPERHLIERARLAGATLNDCVERFGVGRDAVARHMAAHVSDTMKAQLIIDQPVDELVKKAADEGRNLIDYLTITRAIVLQQLQVAGATNSARGTAALAGRMIELIKEMGALTGQLLRAAPTTSTTVNNTAIFMASPAFNSLQSMLLERLGPFPEARAAVVAGLMDLERQMMPPGFAGPMLEHAHAA